MTSSWHGGPPSLSNKTTATTAHQRNSRVRWLLTAIRNQSGCPATQFLPGSLCMFGCVDNSPSDNEASGAICIGAGCLGSCDDAISPAATTLMQQPSNVMHNHAARSTALARISYYNARRHGIKPLPALTCMSTAADIEPTNTPAPRRERHPPHL